MQDAISIIIPVYHEENIILKFLEHVNNRFSGTVYEIIVVDGDKHASTIKHIHDPSVIRLTSEKGRSNQMNLGAANSKYNILFFLHADSMLPKKPFLSITKALAQPHMKAGAFDLCIASQNMLIRLIEKLASIRSRITQIPYGDQGLFIRKDIFNEIGGYSNIPIMEDIDIMLKLKKMKYQITILNTSIKTSARRWETQGILYCSMRNIVLSSLFYLGTDPNKLVNYYDKKNRSGRWRACAS